MADVAKPASGRDTTAYHVRWFRDNADGTFGEEVSAATRYWDTGSLTWVKGTQPGASGGGGPATIADGADVAQGTTTDASSANTVVGILKAIKAAVQGTLTVGSHPVTNAGTFAVQADTELPAAVVLADGAANPTVPGVSAFGMIWNGATWDRAPGSAAAGLKVDVSDRAARLLGVVDKGKVWDGTNIAAVKAGVIAVVGDNPLVVTLHPSSAPTATQPVSAATLPLPTGAATSANQSAVKAASTLAVATDTSQVVQQSPMRADASTLAVTAVSAANAAVTLTLPAAAAGLFHYITSIEIVGINPTVTAIAAAATTLTVTTTNLPGSPAWTFGTLLAAGAEKLVTRFAPTTPIKSSVAATNTTIVAPAIGAGGLVRINVTYYTAP